MENNHRLGLYVSYYLAKFNKAAYLNLGYGNQLATHKKIGEILNINYHTIKNWRDEFDRFYQHRVGWHQREPRPAILEMKKDLDQLPERKILEIVKSILESNKESDVVNKSEELIIKDNFIAKNRILPKKNNELAIIVAYYLSKYDKEGLSNLGYKNDSEAFENISLILGVKKNYIKFRRDEFDPVHPWRKGFHKRAMDKRIICTIESLQDLSEADMREIVLAILHDEKYRNSDEIKQIISLLSETKNEKKVAGKFILRGPTGKQAEEYFIKHFSLYKEPLAGKLIDCRDIGAGYDFKIESEKGEYYVEVKGLSDIAGGILLTNKEWVTALAKESSYYLCIVSNIKIKPNITFIANPASKLSPKKKIIQIEQIQWTISSRDLQI